MLAIAPVWYMSSKMDWENEALVMNVRLGFALASGVCMLCAAMLHFKIKAPRPDAAKVIFVKKPPSFAEPNPKWGKTTYGVHDKAELNAAVTQVFMGVAMTMFLHFKMGIKQSILMQCVMMPLSFFEAPVVKRHLLGSTGRCYEEKFEGEDMPEEPDDKPAAVEGAVAAAGGADAGPSADDVLASLIQEVWDAGKGAGGLYEGLLAAVAKADNKDRASDSDATALMVLAAGVGDVAPYLKRAVGLGCGLDVTDDEVRHARV